MKLSLTAPVATIVGRSALPCFADPNCGPYNTATVTAMMIVDVSATEGDAAGYDIRSFELDGRVRYIEVKATEGGASTSFFISANEVAFSEQRTDSYHSCR